MRKREKKIKRCERRINGHSLIQTRTWWTGVDKKKERKRERESSISQVTWNTNIALSQDLYHSWRHRASSQGGLESLGKKVSSVGLHALPRMKTERRPQWTQVLGGARVLLAEIQAYISLVKWLLSHYKEWNSISFNKMDNLIHLSPLTSKRVTEGS